MTIDIPTRAPEQAPDSGRRGLRGGPQITLGRSSRSNGGAPLVVGGQPRANLLPPEVILKRRQLKTRRALRFGVVLVAIGTAAACVGTFGISTAAQVQLQLTQDAQNRVLMEQAQYQDVRDVQLTIDTIKAGQQVGASTEINWRDFIMELQQTLPAGVILKTVKVEGGTPMEAFLQSDAPLLQGTRVGSISFSAYSATLPDIPNWLRGLTKVSGYVDAIPGSVTEDEGSGYSVEVLMHFNEGAFSMRFDPEHMAEVAAQEAAAAKSDGTIKSMAPAEDEPTTTDGEGN
jgi:Tfp pilus assembly protein PilN